MQNPHCLTQQRGGCTGTAQASLGFGSWPHHAETTQMSSGACQRWLHMPIGSHWKSPLQKEFLEKFRALSEVSMSTCHVARDPCGIDRRASVILRAGAASILHTREAVLPQCLAWSSTAPETRHQYKVRILKPLFPWGLWRVFVFHPCQEINDKSLSLSLFLF